VVTASADCVVKEIKAKEGMQVSSNQIIMLLEEKS
jgi:pyruvate/2-oxoglutarate dehydrogenase complex dihydrolipoamide acyltransferase (E2) component